MVKRKRSTSSKFYKHLGLLLLGIPVTIILFIVFLSKMIWRIFLRPGYNYVINTGQDAVDWFQERYYDDED